MKTIICIIASTFLFLNIHCGLTQEKPKCPEGYELDEKDNQCYICPEGFIRGEGQHCVPGHVQDL